ncbi:phosphatidylethanolamine-binding protein [Suillus fuscotomentosus]|uniref:Phosphatidylethanolamine-binding protein n=1 Tax=Suillus fuscotomentosus TaxID=1912939 RepID=A0AAD4ELZ3_9AGAM|nr:phosphatidylethanolamine-binding protein [Suillus fuscotomentosus]KAG1908632.1 phosphatidylethanolamine-binding protein [Suillus fuscotomentosus]
MLALRRVQPWAVGFAQRSATKQVALASTAVDTDGSHSQSSGEPVAPQKHQSRAIRTRRPRISLQHPREWNRPLAFGVLPAFDEALKVIKEDSMALKDEVTALEGAIAREKETPQPDQHALRVMEDRLRILEVQSEINFPQVRWKCANGMADMSKAVDRHLLEQRWRKEGALDLLMERIHQMKVVPDVLPDIHPSLDLRVNFPKVKSDAGLQATVSKTVYERVEPGVFLLPEQTVEPPKIYTTVFHPEERLYTLLMIDPDFPDETNKTFQTYLHWLQPNIPLSSVSPSSVPNLNTHTAYIPPHPQRGTNYHRYTILLLPQHSRLSIHMVAKDKRTGFDVRTFMEKHGLDKNVGGGVHMWREVWSEGVPAVYKEILKTAEPKFGRMPKADRYGDFRGKKRYV